MAEPTIQPTLQRAVRHHQAGRLVQAEQLYRQVLARQPDLAETHCALGDLLKHRGQWDQAIAAYRRALALKPNFPEACYNLGNALKDQGQWDQAIAVYRQTLLFLPNAPEVHCNLGSALMETGRLDDALIAYRQAIALRPDLAEAHFNLGNALRDKGELFDAVAAYRRAVALKPAYAEAHCNLGDVLTRQGKLDEALAACGQALALKPNLAEAHAILGNALKDQAQLDQALAAYRRAIALKSDATSVHSALAYSLHFHPGYDAAAIAAEHRRWNQVHARPLAGQIRPHPDDRSPDRRLRLGYVSPDFRDHVVGRNLLPLLHNHDHQQFEIVGYADVRRPDLITHLSQGCCDQWRHIVGQSDAAVAEQVRQDRIDILVDLTLHMACNRLLVFARKPAPVQVTFAGYPGSTGLSTIDYRLTDPYLDPPGLNDACYSEQSCRLPDSFWCYDPLSEEPPVNALPAASRGWITFGCLNNFCKVNELALRLWGQVMRAVAGSRLMLLTEPGSHRQWTMDLLRQEGISPDCVEFVSKCPRPQYLELYHRIDLALDSFPYNGHTTSLDGYWMGVPVVTLVGQTAVSRAGWSQLSNLGLTDLAAKTPEQFVQIAVNLAHDLPRLTSLRKGLRERMRHSPLMNPVRFARGVEQAYRTMWHRFTTSPGSV